MFEGLLEPMHIVVILAIALIFFGPGKLADLGSGLGKGIREFRKALKENDGQKDATDVKLMERRASSAETSEKELS